MFINYKLKTHAVVYTFKKLIIHKGPYKHYHSLFVCVFSHSHEEFFCAEIF